MRISIKKELIKPDIERASHYLHKTRERLNRHRFPLDSLSIEEIIQKVRKTREQIWEKKIAAHPVCDA